MVKRDRWSIFITTITAIGTMAAAALMAVDFFAAPTTDLQADVAHHLQYHPPGVRKVMYTYGLRFSPSPPDLTTCDPPIMWDLDPAPTSVLQNERAYDLPKQVWTVSVKNEGDLTARGVKTHIPDATFAALKRPGEPNTYKVAYVGNIELGDLRPGESVNLIAWSPFPYEVAWFGPEDVSIVHHSGRGEINYARPVAGVFQWLDGHPFLAFLIGWLAVLGVTTVPEAVFQTGRLVRRAVGAVGPEDRAEQESE